MNAAIYARVSTTKQAEKGYSLETQIELCQKKAIELGATSIKVYKDDVSGGYMDRPELNNLRDAVAAGLHDYVIVYDTDRFARDTLILLLLTEEIEKNAKLVYVNSEYSTTPEGRLFYEIKGSFAKYERMRILDRFNRGRRGKLKKGLPIMDSHVYGYDFVNGNYVINEREATVVRFIFDYYINHAGGQKNVINVLHKKGIPSPLGTPTWRTGVVCNILRRQQYTGEYYSYRVYRKKTGIKKTTDIKRDSSEWIPMSCPAIISKETFQKAEEKRNQNRIQKIRETKYHALLQGIAYCGICGKKLIVHHHYEKGKDYLFYKCINKCGNRIMQAEIIDKQAHEHLKKICRSEKLLSKYTEDNEPQKEPVNVEKERERINQQRNAIMNWFSQDYITAEQCTEKLQALKRQEESLVQQETKKINTADIVSAVKVSATTFTEKRKLFLSVCQKVLITRKGNKFGKDYDIDLHFVFK